MLYSEFTKLAGFEVKENYYHAVIEPEYENSDLDKFEWVKQWKKNGGIQKAYDAMVSYLEDQKGLTERLKEINENQAMIIRECREENYQLRNKIDDLESQVDFFKEESNKCQEENLKSLIAYKELGEWLIEQSQVIGIPELRDKAVCVLTEKYVVNYKLQHDLPLWDADKKFIIENLK